MRLAALDINLNNLALEVYLSGCVGPHCKNCHNPELWSFSYGDEITMSKTNSICEKIKDGYPLIKNVMIMGGEPLDQDLDKLITFLISLKYYCHQNKIKLWLFTRRELNELPEIIFGLCDYIKTGSYNEELLVEDHIECGLKLASSNQHVLEKNKDY